MIYIERVYPGSSPAVLYTETPTVERSDSYRSQCKMSSSKKIDLSGDFATSVYLSEAQNPIPYILFTCIQYTYSHREGGGGEGQQSQSWVENTNMTDCIARSIFLDDDILFWRLYS